VAIPLGPFAETGPEAAAGPGVACTGGVGPDSDYGGRLSDAEPLPHDEGDQLLIARGKGSQGGYGTVISGLSGDWTVTELFPEAVCQRELPHAVSPVSGQNTMSDPVAPRSPLTVFDRETLAPPPQDQEGFGEAVGCVLVR
jgi:hypothetical protein